MWSRVVRPFGRVVSVNIKLRCAPMITCEVGCRSDPKNRRVYNSIFTLFHSRAPTSRTVSYHVKVSLQSAHTWATHSHTSCYQPTTNNQNEDGQLPYALPRAGCKVTAALSPWLYHCARRQGHRPGPQRLPSGFRRRRTQAWPCRRQRP